MIESEDNKEYLPIEGLADFNRATAELLLGKDHPAVREVHPAPASLPRLPGCDGEAAVYVTPWSVAAAPLVWQCHM